MTARKSSPGSEGDGRPQGQWLEGRLQRDRAEEGAAQAGDVPPRDASRPPKRRTRGTGDPDTPLDERTRDQLYNLARELGIPRRSRMTKDELVEAIRGRG